MRLCKVEGCGMKHFAKGYCVRHYLQIKRFGRVVEKNTRTPNEIILYNDYAEVILKNNKQKIVGKVIIDLEDVIKVKDYKWNLSHGYAASYHLLMHRLIMNSKINDECDHRDRNKLNNRKYNLRNTNRSINAYNTVRLNKNISGCIGVRFIKTTGKWRADIRKNYKNIYLGVYNNFDDAVEARKKAELKYFGDYK